MNYDDSNPFTYNPATSTINTNDRTYDGIKADLFDVISKTRGLFAGQYGMDTKNSGLGGSNGLSGLSTLATSRSTSTGNGLEDLPVVGDSLRYTNPVEFLDALQTGLQSAINDFENSQVIWDYISGDLTQPWPLKGQKILDSLQSLASALRGNVLKKNEENVPSYMRIKGQDPSLNRLGLWLWNAGNVYPAKHSNDWRTNMGPFWEMVESFESILEIFEDVVDKVDSLNQFLNGYSGPAARDIKGMVGPYMVELANFLRSYYDSFDHIMDSLKIKNPDDPTANNVQLTMPI